MTEQVTGRQQLLEALVRPGDQLQSAASRLAEYVFDLHAVPYEVGQAAREALSAVNEWTEVRRNFR